MWKHYFKEYNFLVYLRLYSLSQMDCNFSTTHNPLNYWLVLSILCCWLFSDSKQIPLLIQKSPQSAWMFLRSMFWVKTWPVFLFTLWDNPAVFRQLSGTPRILRGPARLNEWFYKNTFLKLSKLTCLICLELVFPMPQSPLFCSLGFVIYNIKKKYIYIYIYIFCRELHKCTVHF